MNRTSNLFARWDGARRKGWVKWKRNLTPDNHEYHNTVLNDCAASMWNKAKGLDVHFLDNSEVMIDGVRFIGRTGRGLYAIQGPEPHWELREPGF